MKNLRMIFVIIAMSSLVISTDSVDSKPNEVKMFPELKKRNNVRVWSLAEHELEGNCPVLCYCTASVCYCCRAGEVCCPDGCCPDESSFCCPNGRYCCQPTNTVCCIENNLCCPDGNQCCPETCCESTDTCCGEECCDDEQKCCEDSNGDKFCCAEDVDCCNDKCCTENDQCCNEFNSEEQKMVNTCETKPKHSLTALSTNFLENFFNLSDTSYTSKGVQGPLVKIAALAVGQGDSTLIACPKSGDMVIIDMGSKKKTSFKGPQINSLLTDYFKINLNSKMRIIVTHPDIDHYNLFQAGLSGLEDKVDYFILSGKYSEYKNFKTWLEDTFSNQIYVINQGEKCFDNSGCKVSPPGKNSPVIDPQSLCDNDPLVSWTILGANLGTTKNSQSAVIKLQYNTNPSSTVLFPGDFETSNAQDELIAHYQNTNALEATFYKIAHHGASRLANDLKFLKAIKPIAAFVSQAYPDTYFAHPRCDAIEDLLKVDTIENVDANGNSPFACGKAANTPRVYDTWCHAIYATCRESEQCFHVGILLDSNGDREVRYLGPVPVTQENGEIPDETRHTEL